MNILGFLWALPMSIIGAFMALATFWRIGFYGKINSYIWVFYGNPWWLSSKWLGMGVGCFVFISTDSYAAYLPSLMGHEEEHCRQQFVMGPFFPFLYALCSLLSRVLYSDWYHHNWFEIMARERAREFKEKK